MQLLSERFTMGSTPARRVLLVVAVSSPFLALMLASHGLAMVDDAIRPGLDVGVMWALQAALLGALIVNGVVAARLWPRRAQPEPVPGAVQWVCLAIGMSCTAVSIAGGIFTSGTGLILLGLLAVGLLLFDLAPMLVTYVVCLTSLLVHDVGVQAQWWAYAPALRPAVFIDGQPAWWFAGWRQSIFLAGFTVLTALLLLAFASLDRVIRKLSRLSYTDGLTGLANRRRCMEVLRTEMARQARTGQPLCLVLIDADHFKQVNDRHGHLAGDAVLRTLGWLLMRCVRTPIDLAARLGGEEFALILPDTRLDQARAVCTRLREQLAVQRFGGNDHQGDGGMSFRVTVSMGVVQCSGQSAEAMLREADAQLYRAKTGGRDKVCCADEPSEGGPR